jgi:hypothetical protein
MGRVQRLLSLWYIASWSDRGELVPSGSRMHDGTAGTRPPMEKG